MEQVLNSRTDASRLNLAISVANDGDIGHGVSAFGRDLHRNVVGTGVSVTLPLVWGLHAKAVQPVAGCKIRCSAWSAFFLSTRC